MANGDSSDFNLQGPAKATTNKPAEATYGLQVPNTALPAGAAKPAYGELLLQGLAMSTTNRPLEANYGF